MSRGPQGFRQRDVVRALKAIRAAGEEPARIEFDPDHKRFTIITTAGKPVEVSETAEPEREITL
jgi:hypothetical protein